MNFFESIIRELKRMKRQVEKAIAQLPDEDLYWQPDPESNSIAILMKHMAGNMLSRWTDFLTTDGEKPSRNREGEFDEQIRSRVDLVAFWERGWECALGTIESLTPADLDKTVHIRSEAHSVPQAIVVQLVHYSGHAAQIVYIAKHRRGAEWQTLSVPRKR